MLIIGVGNLDRGDDAAGILVARGLKLRGVAAVEHRGGMFDLMELWAAEESVIIVDAARSGADPGTLHTCDGRLGLRDNVFCSSTHAFGLAEVIGLARALNRLPKRLIVCAIEAAHFDHGAPPSAQVLASVERAVEYIASHLIPEITSSC